MSVGPEGSGTRVLALQFLAAIGIDQNNAQLLPLTAAQSGDALLRGEIDAAVMVASWDTPVVRRLLDSADVHVLEFPDVDAFLALHPFLSKLVLPAGTANMIINRPPTDIAMVAPKASLIVRRDLHPAIQYLLLGAADEIHAAPGIFQKAGQFPAHEEEDLPLSKEATRYFKSGDPFLQRYLPFWLATLFDRTVVLLVPILGLAFPLMRFAPMLYSWRVRRGLVRWYGELKKVEDGVRSDASAEQVAQASADIDRIEASVNEITLPLGFTNQLYDLLQHIEVVRRRLGTLGSQKLPRTEIAGG